MQKSSHLGGLNAAYIEDLYETYLEDPGAVAEVWGSYFETLRVV
jgi:2-oxoglutarate dehydrogenase E1 component